MIALAAAFAQRGDLLLRRRTPKGAAPARAQLFAGLIAVASSDGFGTLPHKSYGLSRIQVVEISTEPLSLARRNFALHLHFRVLLMCATDAGLLNR